jgi:3-(methylthio)propanoyl-CoA dehydrogenase
LVGCTNPHLTASTTDTLAKVSEYRPPVSDLSFVLEHVVGYPAIAALPGFEHADLETVTDLLHECGDFMAKVVAPTNRVGDTVGARRNADGSVTLPPGFVDAYRKYVDSGWGSIPFPEQFGGGGFPHSVGLAIQEMMQSANLAFSLGPLLTQGAIDALLHYGSDEQKDRYLPKMITGEWTGTMNLTEPQAGSDVGALTTRAVANGDGSYAITGQKIYITYGEHDAAEQIVHLVLARTPGAPAGTRGISCFIVPKFIVNDDETLGERNAVSALSIEHKLGIHGSPTCVMAYENATGYLIGAENQGMRIMFVMMNIARLSVGTQGLAIAERAFQQSLDHARQRTQSGSAIIDFPDVRRMLLTQKASIAALRRLMLFNAVSMDRSTHDPDPVARARAMEIVGLLTPICKSFGTDLGNELSSIALQVQGGMGYIEETGAAQFVRDVRIAAIYEGTNGIQAADLVGRKLAVRGGASFTEFIAELREIIPELDEAGEQFATISTQLTAQLAELTMATEWMLATAPTDLDAALAGSSPYLRMWGLCVGGWLMARSAIAAAGTGDAGLAREQLMLASFYAEQILPQVSGLSGAATAGSRDLFTLSGDELAR